MTDIKMNTNDDDGSVTVVISGRIDENADFENLKIPEAKTLVIDLSGVSLINSTGLRSWVYWIKGLNKSLQVVFRNCPHIVVDQMNILEGFLPMGARVESFEVPYHCDSCEHEEMVQAERGRDFMEGTADQKEGVLLPEERPCPKCGEQMDMDVLPEKYFKFLKYRR